MRPTVVGALDLYANAAAPHGVRSVQPLHRLLERQSQLADGLFLIHRYGVASIGARVERADHSLNRGVVRCRHSAGLAERPRRS